jgi:HK97 family phage portal protein
LSWWNTFKSWFDRDGRLDLSTHVAALATEVYFKELATQACVNLIANTVARSEFKTFDKGKEIRGENYYLLNVESNPNRSANKFWRDVVYRLVHDNECLVIMQGDHLYLADSYNVVSGTFVENLYTDIRIGDLDLTTKHRESEVLHFELHNERIKDVVDGLYTSYGKLIAAAQRHYKRNASRKGALTIPTSYPQTEKAQTELRELLEKRFKTFFEAESDAVVPLTNGITYKEIESGAATTKGSMEGRDIRAFIDDVFDMVAIAFQVPPQLLKGNVADTEKAVNNFLTFCINPLAELLTDEINRKMYGKKAYLERTYMKLDTSHIRAVDIRDVANALDVLLRIGAYSIDDCLLHLGMEPLSTDWSRQRWMTKNYQPIEQAAEGGD